MYYFIAKKRRKGSHNRENGWVSRFNLTFLYCKQVFADEL
jgi:hypothetical protein